MGFWDDLAYRQIDLDRARERERGRVEERD